MHDPNRGGYLSLCQQLAWQQMQSGKIFVDEVTRSLGLSSSGDPRLELVAALLYIAMPMFIGALLSRFAIYLWMLRSQRSPYNRSPASISAMLGVAMYPFAVYFGLFLRTMIYVESFDEVLPIVLFGFVATVIFCIPIIVIIGLALGYYISTASSKSRAQDCAMIVLSVFCIPIQYVYLLQLFHE